MESKYRAGVESKYRADGTGETIGMVAASILYIISSKVYLKRPSTLHPETGPGKDIAMALGWPARHNGQMASSVGAGANQRVGVPKTGANRRAPTNTNVAGIYLLRGSPISRCRPLIRATTTM